jgi:SAM-dependent methyltransferase
MTDPHKASSSAGTASVKQHYERHLALFYEWMTGDFDVVQQEQQALLQRWIPLTKPMSRAVDLGAGHGIHAISLANMGYDVVAIDFNEHLLESLRLRAKGMHIDAVQGDLTKFKAFVQRADVVICMGDTLAHLDEWSNVETLLRDCRETLSRRGKLVLSFRDYSVPLEGDKRFIPVRADGNRILTCFLEHEGEYVFVTDLLYENHEGRWEQKVSRYRKLRLTLDSVRALTNTQGFEERGYEVARGMHYLILEKR